MKSIELSKPKVVYKFSQYPVSKLEPYDDDISDALLSIDNWFLGGNFKVNKKEIKPALSSIVKLFPYKPWGKSVFRAFKVKRQLIDKLKEGRVYNIKTGASVNQSWTTSLSNAVRYGIEKLRGDFIVVQLVSSGHELANYDWLLSVAINLCHKDYNDLEIWTRAHNLKDTLLGLEQEDEVILQLAKTNKVKVVYLNPSDESKSIRG